LIGWRRAGERRILIILAAGRGLGYVRYDVIVFVRKCWGWISGKVRWRCGWTSEKFWAVTRTGGSFCSENSRNFDKRNKFFIFC